MDALLMMHDVLSFSAMLLAGVIGALIVGPLGRTARRVAVRVRVHPHDR
jgi:hypothetical protein